MSGNLYTHSSVGPLAGFPAAAPLTPSYLSPAPGQLLPENSAQSSGQTFPGFSLCSRITWATAKRTERLPVSSGNSSLQGQSGEALRLRDQGDT